jgi:hypothetical protein
VSDDPLYCALFSDDDVLMQGNDKIVDLVSSNIPQSGGEQVALHPVYIPHAITKMPGEATPPCIICGKEG